MPTDAKIRLFCCLAVSQHLFIVMLTVLFSSTMQCVALSPMHSGKLNWTWTCSVQFSSLVSHCALILGIRWHDFVRNTEVVDRTNLPSVPDVIAKRRNSLFGHVVRLTRQPTAHYHRSQQQELATALVLVGGDSQDARAIHGSSRSARIHPSAFVLNGLRLVVVATPGWRNGPLLSTRSDDWTSDDLRRFGNEIGGRHRFFTIGAHTRESAKQSWDKNQRQAVTTGNGRRRFLTAVAARSRFNAQRKTELNYPVQFSFALCIGL